MCNKYTCNTMHNSNIIVTIRIKVYTISETSLLNFFGLPLSYIKKHISVYMCIYIYIHIHMHVYIYIYIYTHTYIHTYIHSYIHTYTYNINTSSYNIGRIYLVALRLCIIIVYLTISETSLFNLFGLLLLQLYYDIHVLTNMIHICYTHVSDMLQIGYKLVVIVLYIYVN